MDNKQLVISKMKEAGKPLKAGEVAELTGLESKEIDKIFKVLKQEELITSPKRCYWEPK